MKCISVFLDFSTQNMFFANFQAIFAKEKAKKTPNTQKQKGFDEKEIKIRKKYTEVNK